MTEFFLKSVDQKKLIGLFVGTRHPGRAEFFVNSCEREILSWLKNWPPEARSLSKETAAAAERVRVKAFDLLLAIEGLDQAASHLILPWVLEPKDDGAPVDIREEKQDVKWFVQEIRDLAAVVESLQLAAQNAHSWDDGPITRRRDQDLCHSFTRVHIDAFGALPSANQAGVFLKFCGEIANCIAKHPGAPQDVQITRGMVERSRKSQAAILEITLKSNYRNYY